MVPGLNHTGSKSSAPAAQNIPVFAPRPASNQRAAKMQRGGRCQSASWRLQDSLFGSAEGNPSNVAHPIHHAGHHKAGQALRPYYLGYVQGIQERETAQIGKRRVLRGMLTTWPTSKILSSISLFFRHVKNYFAFSLPSSLLQPLRPIPRFSK
jgi:hypothetical protein